MSVSMEEAQSKLFFKQLDSIFEINTIDSDENSQTQDEQDSEAAEVITTKVGAKSMLKRLPRKSDVSNGRWTKTEHQLFIKGKRVYSSGLIMYGRDWKRVSRLIGTRSGTQIRSHAQKFFNRIKREFKTTEPDKYIKQLVSKHYLTFSPQRERKTETKEL